MKKIKPQLSYLLIQFIIGLMLLLDGINTMLFSDPVVIYSNKFFQHQIGNGTISFIFGIGLLVGFFLKLKDYRHNANKN